MDKNTTTKICQSPRDASFGISNGRISLLSRSTLFIERDLSFCRSENPTTRFNLHLYVREGSDAAKRQQVLDAWYRQQLQTLIPELIAKWQPVIKVNVADWGVKQMKTRWGTCNIRDRRIWLALELAKKPLICLEYVVVHEMTHLLERYHNERFYGFMTTFLADWRNIRLELNQQNVNQQILEE